MVGLTVQTTAQYRLQTNDLNQDTVEKWKQKLSVLIKGFEAKNIYNADEIGLF